MCNHFAKVFNPTSQTNFPVPHFSNSSEAADTIFDQDINLFEVSIAIKNLKSKKAEGPDLIPNVYTLLLKNNLYNISVSP